MRRLLATLSAVAVACLTAQTATAQFFTNDLTDAVSVATDFNENIGIANNSVWTYTNDYALAEDGTTNTVLQGGAVLDWVTADTDEARSYLATVYSNYLDHSWTARVAVEAPSSTQPWIFVGLGAGKPDSNASYEPRDGESVYWRFQSGNSGGSKRITVLDDEGNTLLYTGVWKGDPGYDFYLTYNHLSKILKFEIDDWNGGRFSDLDPPTAVVSVDGILTETNNMHIFFGSNAKVTWGDFEVYEIESSAIPPAPQNLYAWPETNNIVKVYWDELVLATSGYNVYRSLDNVDSNFVQIATGVMTNFYTDTDVTNGITYWYKASGVNDSGEGDRSNMERAVPNEYYIFGVMNNAGGAAKDRWFYELFDGMTDTFMDDNASGGYAGLDYGDGNAQQIVQINFWLRDDSWGNGSSYEIVVDGVTNNVNRARYFSYGNSFEGSNDGINWTWIQAITNIAQSKVWNELEVTDATAYRYVRYYPSSGNNNFAMAEVEFLTASDFTANGTLIPWLESYGLTEADDEEDNDSDGLLTWEEYIAGTVPTNAASVLTVNSFANTTNGWVVSWQSVEGKDYSIITNESLMGPTPGVAASNIVGLADETSITSSLPAAESLFLQVEVK